jgi:circadian clock protein KaiB
MTSPAEVTYDLTLYVSGASDLSARAIAGARQLCADHLLHRCRLTVLDVHDDPVAAQADGVLVTPTMVRHRPLPMRTYAGDVTRTDEVLVALGIQPAGGAPRVRPETPPAPTGTRAGA